MNAYEIGPLQEFVIAIGKKFVARIRGGLLYLRALLSTVEIDGNSRSDELKISPISG